MSYTDKAEQELLQGIEQIVSISDGDKKQIGELFRGILGSKASLIHYEYEIEEREDNYDTNLSDTDKEDIADNLLTNDTIESVLDDLINQEIESI